MSSLKEKILRYITEAKAVPQAEVEKINGRSRSFNELKFNLVSQDIVNEQELLLFLSRELSLPFLDLDRYRVFPENKDLLPRELAYRYKVLPLSRIGEVLTIATANPLDLVALDDLKLTSSFKKISLVLAGEEKITAALQRLYSDSTAVSFMEKDQGEEAETASKPLAQEQGAGLETLVKESTLPPIVRVVDMIVYEGLKRGASDIHIEPAENDLVVRYRIDGVLQHGLNLPQKNQSAILARLKIMSSLDITEFRVPQDGRFKVKYENREIDFRVSSLPTHFGEKVVLRILDRESLSLGIQKLGFSDIPLKLFEEAISAPFGIILVTGPTGSGKSTTLYSVLNRFNVPEKNIITIEDPVEYQLDGITQVQAKAEIGLTFASTLRSVLRQSPDIVMVGEIRDTETADIAIKASLTGEFIFSTLHTNNSIGAITRLIDMGIEPFLVASSVIACTAQRLVRKLCPKCKEEEIVEAGLLERIGFPCDRPTLWKAKGCKLCNNTGYKGRIALLEVLLFDDTIRDMIVKRASEADIEAYARQKSEFRSFREDGYEKCLAGITSLEEVLRVAG